MTRDELLDRIIDRAAAAERALVRGGLTPWEKVQAQKLINRALKAIDYGKAAWLEHIEYGVEISDRLK